MPTPRKQLVSLIDTPWYHCVSRCVRRAWLFGVDPYNGIDYSHRRDWVVARLEQLVDVFAIDVAAYAVMSNHTHLVLHVDSDRAAQWTWEEVIEQWHKIYQGNFLSQRFMKNELLSKAELNLLKKSAELWRERLHSISWFMSALNEHIARRANIEDEVTGKYWEARFKSQALLDETAILTCMAYVDLNPIRANMADTPEESHFTSIKQRIKAAGNGAIPKNLCRFQGTAKKDQKSGIPCALEDYIELVDATGRVIRRDKRGAIDASLSPILERLSIDAETWQHIATTFEKSCGPWVGGNIRLAQFCDNTGKHWVCGTEGNQKLYPP